MGSGADGVCAASEADVDGLGAAAAAGAGGADDKGTHGGGISGAAERSIDVRDPAGVAVRSNFDSRLTTLTPPMALNLGTNADRGDRVAAEHGLDFNQIPNILSVVNDCHVHIDGT